MSFNTWLDTFVDEKGYDIEQAFEVEGASGPNHIPLGVLIEHIKIAPMKEQNGIKAMLIRLDIANADVMLYFKHLCQAIAR